MMMDAFASCKMMACSSVTLSIQRYQRWLPKHAGEFSRIAPRYVAGKANGAPSMRLSTVNAHVF